MTNRTKGYCDCCGEFAELAHMHAAGSYPDTSVCPACRGVEATQCTVCRVTIEAGYDDACEQCLTCPFDGNPCSAPQCAVCPHPYIVPEEYKHP